MKIPLRKKNNGSAVLVIIILLGLMMVYVSSNAIALSQVKRDIQLMEKRQKARYLPRTNGVQVIPTQRIHG